MNPQDTRQQWLNFCDQLKSAADVLVQPGVPDYDKTQQEGLRYLTRLLRLSLEKNLEFLDETRIKIRALAGLHSDIGMLTRSHSSVVLAVWVIVIGPECAAPGFH